MANTGRVGARWTAYAAGVALGAYAASAIVAAQRYGRPRAPQGAEADPLLDALMPFYDVAERHWIAVRAPAATTLAAARDQDLLELPFVRAIFKARELVMGGTPDQTVRPRGLLAATQSLGWAIVAERPDREVVVAAVAQPWEANPTFRAMPADTFATFGQPGSVKIAWTLRADPIGERTSIFRTETRAVATDPAARHKFRRYWSLVSPGIRVIRRLSLGPLKREAERRAQALGLRRPTLNAMR